MKAAKKCTRCGEEKDVTEFYTCGPKYRMPECKVCNRARARMYNKEVRASYKAKNIERIREQDKLYRREWRKKHKGEYGDNGEWRRAHPEQFRAAVAAWAKRNPEKIRAKNAKDVEELRDYYVRKMISASSGLNVNDVPQSATAAKREQLKIRRLILKELKREKLNRKEQH